MYIQRLGEQAPLGKILHSLRIKYIDRAAESSKKIQQHKLYHMATTGRMPANNNKASPLKCNHPWRTTKTHNQRRGAQLQQTKNPAAGNSLQTSTIEFQLSTRRGRRQQQQQPLQQQGKPSSSYIKAADELALHKQCRRTSQRE